MASLFLNSKKNKVVQGKKRLYLKKNRLYFYNYFQAFS